MAYKVDLIKRQTLTGMKIIYKFKNEYMNAIKHVVQDLEGKEKEVKTFEEAVSLFQKLISNGGKFE